MRSLGLSVRRGIAGGRRRGKTSAAKSFHLFGSDLRRLPANIAIQVAVALRPVAFRYLVGLWLLPVVFCQSVMADAVKPDLQPSRPALMVDRYSDQYDDLFRYLSNRYFGPFVDWRWFKAQAVAESRLQSTARSHKGASGLMQLLPSTFLELQSERSRAGDILDPEVNVSAAMKYNRTLFRKWNRIGNAEDRLMLMLASYNAGFYRVAGISRAIAQMRGWDDIAADLPGETRAYVRKIRELMQPVAPSDLRSVAISGVEPGLSLAADMGVLAQM